MPKAVDGTWEPPKANGRVPVANVWCIECGDMGWSDTADEDEAPMVKPCRHCRPLVFMRWQRGHYDVGHGCEECAAVRSGRATVHDFTDEGVFLGASGPSY